MKQYRLWLSENMHADMTYMQKRIDEKIDIERLLPNTRSLLVLGSNYYRKEDEFSTDDSFYAQISRYAITRDYHKIIRKRLRKLESFCENEFNVKARGFVDSGPVLERAYAEMAGLGYIGKNTMLISKSYGSWIFLSSLLITEKLEPDTNTLSIRCGKCRKCIDACPTQAILPNNLIDSNKCISYLTIENRNEIPIELRELIGNWIFGCDICQEVCPHNNRAIQVENDEFATIRIKDRMISLEEVLNLNEESFLKTFQGTPIMRAKYRGFMRNACVVAGNSQNKRFLTSLKKFLEITQDDMLREHAIWAINKIKASSTF